MLYYSQNLNGRKKRGGGDRIVAAYIKQKEQKK